MTTESTDRLFDAGCLTCGSVHSMRDPPVCGPCFARFGCERTDLAREIERRKTLAAPRPAALPKGTRHTHESVEGSVFELLEDARPNGAVSGAWSADMLETRADGSVVAHKNVPFLRRFITLLPAPPPPEVAKDPYEEHDFVDEGPARTGAANRSLRATRIAALSVSSNPLDRLASKRAQLFTDMSRPSPRTRKDKMNRDVTWTSWARTEWGGK